MTVTSIKTEKFRVVRFEHFDDTANVKVFDDVFTNKSSALDFVLTREDMVDGYFDCNYMNERQGRPASRHSHAVNNVEYRVVQEEHMAQLIEDNVNKVYVAYVMED